MSSLFDAEFYKASELGSGSSRSDLFEHYLQVGIFSNASPSPLFDAAFVESSLPRHLDDDRPVMIRWLTSDARLRIAPTQRFDSEYYVSKYNDVERSGVPAFDHFVEYGAREGRQPNSLFDMQWYAEQVRNANRTEPESLYLDYLRCALGEGVPPRESLVPLFGKVRVAGFGTHAVYDKLVSSTKRWISEFGLGSFDFLAEIFVLSSGREEFSSSERLIDAFGRFLSSGSLPYDLSESDIKLLRKLFVPSFYKRLIVSSDEGDHHLFSHYLLEGIAAELQPSPLFDKAVVDSALPSASHDKRPSIVRWLTSSEREQLVPTVRFSSRHYLSKYHDVANAGVAPFEHFIHQGAYENREPNGLFDTRWYKQDPQKAEIASDIPPYVRYLCDDLLKGKPPSAFLAPLFGLALQSGADLSASFDALLLGSEPWLAEFGTHKFVILSGLFLSSSYAGGALPSDATAIERFLHLLEYGAREGIDPGPLFDSKVYLASARRAGLFIPEGANPLLHFLAEGVHRRIVPTSIFNEDDYLRRYPDIEGAHIWAFEHFVVFGVFEGRTCSTRRGVTIASRPEEPNNAFRNWATFWALQGHSTVEDPELNRIATVQAKVMHVLSSDRFAEVTRRARDLEPAIGDVNGITEILAAPLHDYRDVVRQKVMKRLRRSEYDSVICIPWLRTGGADLVACLLAEALIKVRPGEKVLLLQTEFSHCERPEWVPTEADRVDISDLLASLDRRAAEFLLFSILAALAPKRLINVNSRSCWSMLERFGTRLRPLLALYSYLFCWDETEAGVKAGYPSQFFASTAPMLDCTFTDTDYLRRELKRIYRTPELIESTLVTLHSPPRIESSQRMLVNTGVLSGRDRVRPLVLWGGRLDRQKRFDIVQLVAAALPQIEFLCWGTPILDKGPDLSRSPSNLQLRPSFTSFDDLPLDECDLWLYTSAWDGMPTTLIELARRGVAIVASAVGGVPELIDESTGWPVYEFDSVPGYVEAINDALARPEERIARASRLCDRARTRYSKVVFCNELRAVLDRESSRLP